MIAVRTLLKSCAMPPASCPIACIFWLCAKFSCSVRCSVVSSANTIALASSPLCASAAETKKRADRAALALDRRIDRRDFAFAFARRRDRRAQAGVIALRDAAKDRGPDLAGRRLQSPGRQTRKGAVGSPHAPFASTVAIAIGVELKMRAKRTSAARKSSPVVSLGPRSSTSVREGPGRPSLENATRWRMRTGRKRPWRRLQIDVELLGRHFARPAGNDRHQRRAVGGHDIRQFELAGRELGEIIVEPAGERRIHIGDRAVWLRREKAGGRVIEIVDHMLQVLEEAFVPFVFARDVGDGPERRVVFCDAFERAHPDAIPGRAAFAVQRRRDAQFLDAAFAGAEPARDGRSLRKRRARPKTAARRDAVRRSPLAAERVR